MAASTSDKLMKSGASTVTTLSAPGKALAAASITVGSTTNYPTDTGIVIAIRVVDSGGELVAGTYTEWYATVTSGTTLGLDTTPAYGSDQVYAAGSTTQVFIPLSSAAHNRKIDGLLVSLDQDGTLKAGAVDNAAVLANDVVTTAKIADDAVTDDKLDYPRWYQEIGRTTLGVAGDTITVSSLPARQYLRIIISTRPTGGTTGHLITFNGDSGSNYATRFSDSGAADSTATSVASFAIVPGVDALNGYGILDIVNIANQEKLMSGFGTRNTTGAATAPGPRREGIAKWTNTAAQISSITMTNTGTGDFAIGSQVIVLGHD